jgi:predicted amidophosphoribosyltransferase
MNCKCGEFKFSGPGEYRNCEAYINNAGESCVICPKCGRHYASIFSSDRRCIIKPDSKDETDGR